MPSNLFSIDRKQPGFTIVELLIVIVVIGILAAIVVVTYNGVQERGTRTSLESDLRNASVKLEMHKATNSQYPEDLNSMSEPQSSYSSSTTEFRYRYYAIDGGAYRLCYATPDSYKPERCLNRGDDPIYCMAASSVNNSSVAMHMWSDSKILSSGKCRVGAVSGADK